MKHKIILSTRSEKVEFDRLWKVMLVATIICLTTPIFGLIFTTHMGLEDGISIGIGLVGIPVTLLMRACAKGWHE